MFRQIKNGMAYFILNFIFKDVELFKKPPLPHLFLFAYRE